MTKKLILFTNNAHKVTEVQQILDLESLPVIPYTQIFNKTIEVVEDGDTFKENAIIKVNALPPHPDHIYLAEDSGIEVAHLNGAPGIHSARYAGPNATKQEMCQKLLQDCYGAGDRSAQYQAVMALRFPDNNMGLLQTVSGIVKGHLSYEMAGDGGFGYDPIFIPEDHEKTFAQMPAAQKHALSHRYHALEQVRIILNNYLETTKSKSGTHQQQ